MAKTKNTVIRKTNSDHRYMTRIPTSEMEEAFRELSPNAIKLLLYYYSKHDGWEFIDEKIAEDLVIKKSTVATKRRELIDKGYLLIMKSKVTNYFVGKKCVEEYMLKDSL